MPNIIVGPKVVRRIEDNIKYIIVSHWPRREADAYWRRLVKTRTQDTKKELLQWMLEMGGIEPRNGDGFSYDDIVEATHEISVDDFGKALRLTENDIEDGKAFDRAATWARQMAGSAAMWPQEQAAAMLRGAVSKVKTSYDKVPFFSGAHPINPALGAGYGTYPNIYFDSPFSPEVLAKAHATIARIKSTDGKYRNLRARIVSAGEVERLAVTQGLGAEFFADPVRSGTTASAQNVIKTSYGFEEPIISADFDEGKTAYYSDTTGLYQVGQAGGAGFTLKTRGVWYLIVDLVEDDELAGLIFTERKPFGLNSYSPLDDVILGQMDAWEWQFKGRNAVTFGHPFLVHRFEPQPSNVALDVVLGTP